MEGYETASLHAATSCKAARWRATADEDGTIVRRGTMMLRPPTRSNPQVRDGPRFRATPSPEAERTLPIAVPQIPNYVSQRPTGRCHLMRS
jgi:hypothetical protein